MSLDASEVLHYAGLNLFFDKGTGVFVSKNNGKALGILNIGGYIVIKLKRDSVLAHRLVWLVQSGAWPTHTIDHKNKVTVDNRLKNLRDVGMCGHTPRRPTVSGKMCLRSHRERNAKLWVALRRQAEKNYLITTSKVTCAERSQHSFIDKL